MAAPRHYRPQFYIGSVKNIRETLFSKPTGSHVFRTLFQSLPGFGQLFCDDKFIRVGVRRESLPLFVRCMTPMGITLTQGGYQFLPPRLTNLHCAAYLIAYYAPDYLDWAKPREELVQSILTTFSFCDFAYERSLIGDMLDEFAQMSQDRSEAMNQFVVSWRDAQTQSPNLAKKIPIPRPPKAFKFTDKAIWSVTNRDVHHLEDILHIFYNQGYAENDFSTQKLTSVVMAYVADPGHDVTGDLLTLSYAMFACMAKTPIADYVYHTEWPMLRINITLGIVSYLVSSTARSYMDAKMSFMNNRCSMLSDAVIRCTEEWMQDITRDNGGFPSTQRLQSYSVPTELLAHAKVYKQLYSKFSKSLDLTASPNIEAVTQADGLTPADF